MVFIISSIENSDIFRAAFIFFYDVQIYDGANYTSHETKCKGTNQDCLNIFF